MKARLTEHGRLEVEGKLKSGKYIEQSCPWDRREMCGAWCPHFRVNHENVKLEATEDAPAMVIKEDYVSLTCGGRSVSYDLEVTK